MPARLFLLVAALLVLGTPTLAQPPELFTTPAQITAAAPDLPEGFYAENAASGATFSTPVALAVAPDGRVFVVEKRGRVYVIEDGRKLATPFLDIEAEVLNHHDRGLLGIALDPDFSANGHVYLLYTVDHDRSGDYQRYDVFGRLTRYTASASDPNRADPASRRVLIGQTFATGIPACYYSHAPGTLDFGSDGTLFVGTGDGARYNGVDDGGDYDACFGPGRFPEAEDIGSFRSLWLGSLAGKILRVDPETGLGLPSNPFYTGDPADNASRVWAYGLRNPYRFAALDDGADGPAAGDPGRIILGDVGWTAWEEVNVVRGGEGFGWPCYEGPGPHSGYQGARPAHSGCAAVAASLGAQAAPDQYWHHSNPAASRPAGRTALAIVGGDVYGGTKYPMAYQGAFFYADYPRGWMAAGRIGSGGAFAEQGLFSPNTGYVVDIEYDPTGEHLLYADVVSGVVHRLRHTDGDTNSPPVAQATADPAQGSAPLTVRFSSDGSFDPDGGALSFAWDFGDGATSDLAAPTHTFSGVGTYAVTLTVTDAYTVSASTGLTVTAGGSPPTAQILAPTDGASAAVGESVPLVASGTDPDGGPETLAYRWSVTQVHNNHEHFDVFVSDAPSAAFVVPEHGNVGEIVYYVLNLTVTDPDGLSDTAQHTLYVTPEGTGLPAPWASADVGAVAARGSTQHDGEAFAVVGAGDVWGNADAFHFAYRPLDGDGALTARLADLTGGHPWAKVGLMIRETLERESAHAMVVATPDEGVHLQYRPARGASMVEAVGRAGAAPVWLRIQRVGPVVTAFTSADGAAWTEVGAVAVPMDRGVHVGLMATATDYEGRGDTARGTFADVTVGPATTPPPTGGVPAPWTSTDVGPVAVTGSVGHASGAFTVEGAGDVWGDADTFQFLHRPLDGDGTLTARLAGLDADDPWAKVGVMMRETLDRGARHAMLVVTPENGVHLQHRPDTDGVTDSAPGPETSAPVWLRLVREGDEITAFTSADGAVWSVVGSVALPMEAEIEAGLMATATDYEGRGDAARGTFDGVTLTGSGGSGDLPAPWATLDIGPVAVVGSAHRADGVVTVEGAGDVWGDADAFHFAHQPVDGDATITARLTGLDALHPWAKAGLMIRDDLTRESAHAMLVATPSRGVHLQHRPEAGALAATLAAPDRFDGAPVWLQLQRSGDVIAAAVSTDGVAWEPTASLDLPMSGTVYVGLMATATDYEGRGGTARATFEQVMVDAYAGAAARPAALTAGEPERPFAIETVYPNPFRGQTTARLAIEEPGLYRVDVFDVLGRQVASHEIREEATGVVEVPFDLQGQSSGAYVVRVQDTRSGAVALARVLLVR